MLGFRMPVMPVSRMVLTVTLAVILAVVLPAEGRGVGLTARQRAALSMAGFIRDSVESVPAHEVPGERGGHRSSLKYPTAAFGTASLPLREAVERPPSARDRARARYPLREAVEHRPLPPPGTAKASSKNTVPVGQRSQRPTPPMTPAALPGRHGWPHSIAKPFQEAAGLGWLHSRAGLGALPNTLTVPYQPPFQVPYQLPYQAPRYTQVWPYLTPLRSAQFAQPQQRWGIVASPNFVFSSLGNRQPPPVLTYQAVKSPEPEHKVVCYLEAWAAYRKDIVSYSADNVDPFACTHLLYAFASIDPHSFRVVPQDEEYDLVKGGYRAAVGLKRKNPNLKVLLSVGGWMEGSSKFSRMASRADRRREFVRSVVRTLDAHKFDGVDLDWEYPGAQDLGGLPSDKDHFSLLVDELSEVFRPRGWLLSAAVSPSRFRMEDAYDVPRISQSLDFINLMAFDLHAERDSAADHHAPMAQRPHDASIDIFYNVDYAVKYWIKRGAPAEKLVLGVPFYGRTFTLKDAGRNGPGSAIKGLGKEGRYTQEKGFLSYFEICELQSEGGWMLQTDRAGSPYMVKGDQWVGYEDANSIARKMEYIRKQNLSGVMIWAVDLDDFQGICGTKTPLLNAVRNNIDGADSGYAPPVQGAPSSSLLTVVVRGGEPECIMGEFRSAPDCSHYYMCVHGELVAFKCAPGLQWNKDKNICDWPTNSECKGSELPEPVEQVPQKPDTDTNPEKPEMPEKPEKPDGGYPEESTPSKPDSGEEGTEVIGETDGSEWVTWKPTTTTKNPWAWEPTIVTPAPVVDNDPLPEQSGYFKIVCYFTNWAWYRQGQGKYLPEDINANLCTHIVYGFAVLDYENLVIKAHDSWADFDNKFYERVVELKKKGKKVSLALGGWNDSAGDKYSRLVNNPAARRRFIKHALDFLYRYNFDGLDLDWEYPKCWQVNCDKGPDSDKAAFGAFVRELRVAFNVRKLLLSAAVSPSKTVIDAGYDVPALAASLDWVAVMTYDYHGQWDKKTGHVAPMYFHPDDDFYFFNANYSINYWIEEGVPRRKIVMGMPLYGQSFQLAEASTNGLNARAPGPGTAGEFTRAAGFLAYYEICDRVKNRGWTVVQDKKKRMGPYAFHGNQWVSYDDVDMIRLKSQYIRDMDLGGGMIWALDLDDFRNKCGEGRHPLLKTIRRVLGPAPGSSGATPTSTTSKPDTPEPIQKPEMTEKPESSYKPETSPVVVDNKPDGGEPSPPKPSGETTERPEAGTTESVVQSPANSDFKVVCYFTNWAWYRQDLGKYLPSNIDPDLCTHIVYGFAVLDGSTLTIKPHDSWADLDNKFYEKVTALQKRGVKVTLAIGGWNDSAGDKYSRLANDPTARARFVTDVVEFIEQYHFDGLDLDWEYPKCWQVNCKLGPDSDKEGFAALVSELRAAFNPKGLLLSSAVSPNKAVIDAGYDVPALSRDLDWIAVMAYDYHGQWDKKTGHVAPMYVHPSDTDATFNTNFTINYWISQGADPKKLVLGMPMYGQSFSLADNSNHGLNAPTYGGGEAGDYTRARGFLSYYEICYLVQKKGWTVVRDDSGAMGPYAYLRDQWVSFDDIDMIRYKSEWARKMGLGGGMIWALDLDDFTDRCHCETYPLLKTINRVLRGYKTPAPRCRLVADTETYTDMKPDTASSTGDGGDANVVESAGATEVEISGGSEAVSVVSAGVNAGKECNGQMFAPHESDCNKYYTCQFGELTLQSCPDQLHWSEDHCDWPMNSKCKPSSGPATGATVEQPETTPGTPPGTMPETPTDTKPVVKPPTSVVNPPENEVKPIGNSEYKVVCYFTNWAWYRQGAGKYTPEDIDSDLCTHITYGFAVLDGSTLTIKPHDTWADYDNNFYQKVVAYKKRGIKVLIAIGGWNDSLGDKYSRLVNDPAARKRFIENLIQFIEKHNFDGLDLDWEYPKCWQVNCNLGPESDKEGFASLVRELSAVFKPRGWLLSSAVSPSKLVIDEGYDVPTLSEHFDWIAVMTYDFHGHWDKQTGHVAPLYYVPGDTFDYFNANFTINYWIQKGADRKKLVMGMPMYGQSFALADNNQRGLNAKAYGPGEAGEFTRAGGFLAYYEICDYVKNRGWTVVRDPEGRIGPYAYLGNQWVSYDDVEDIRRKSKFIKQMGLGGGMIWALDLDDFTNRCGCGQHPLLKTINQELRALPYSTINCT